MIVTKLSASMLAAYTQVQPAVDSHCGLDSSMEKLLKQGIGPRACPTGGGSDFEGMHESKYSTPKSGVVGVHGGVGH